MILQRSKIGFPEKRGFTLIELLLVVAIVAVLSVMAIGVMGSAQNDARLASTRARVNVLERIIETELEDYEVRRSPIPNTVLIQLTNQIINDNGWDASRFFVHFRNLRRMLVADLIRTEIPNGRGNEIRIPPSVGPGVVSTLGMFPSPELRAYLLSVGVPDGFAAGVISVADLSAFTTAGVRRWSAWDFDNDGDLTTPANNSRDAEQKLADSSELLYGFLSQIQFNGSSGLDALGNAAFRDTDGDGQLEIVDAWDNPIAFQFQQEALVPPATPEDIDNGKWGSNTVVTEFEIVTNDIAVPVERLQMLRAILPVRPDQVRPFLSSEKLEERDGVPIDFAPL